MDKRLQKRHKRQVTRARERVKVSEPDVRTPEQIRAAREASRPDLVSPHMLYATPPHPAHAAPAADETETEETKAAE